MHNEAWNTHFPSFGKASIQTKQTSDRFTDFFFIKLVHWTLSGRKIVSEIDYKRITFTHISDFSSMIEIKRIDMSDEKTPGYSKDFILCKRGHSLIMKMLKSL